MKLWKQIFPYIDIKHLVVSHLTPILLQLLEGHNQYHMLLMLHTLMYYIFCPILRLVLCPLLCLILYSLLYLIPYGMLYLVLYPVLSYDFLYL